MIILRHWRIGYRVAEHKSRLLADVSTDGYGNLIGTSVNLTANVLFGQSSVIQFAGSSSNVPVLSWSESGGTINIGDGTLAIETANNCLDDGDGRIVAGNTFNIAPGNAGMLISDTGSSY